MLKALACGTSSFKHQEDDPWNLSKPRRSKSCRSSNNIMKARKRKVNPYSSRGLDKFATILAELEERKEKIYAEIGSPEDSLVRFGYSSTDDWIPIVVRLKEQQEVNKAKVCKEKEHQSKVCKEKEHQSKVCKEKEHQSTVKIHNSEILIKSPKGLQVEVKGKKKKKRVMWRDQPQLYLIVIIVMILVCLVISGKSLAILCTSIGWYLLPTMKENKLNFRNSIKKKDYGRWFSEKRITSEPPVVIKSLRRGQSNTSW